MTEAAARANPAEDMSKVAVVTLSFWIMKIAATTVGETAGDLMSMTMNIGYAVSSLILLAAFAVLLVVQIRAKRFHPALFWAVIVATSTAGTTISDFVDRSLGLGYALGAGLEFGVLALVLLAWRLSVGSLAVDYIRSPKVELFYWLAILASNTLGTALGDFLADSSGLGYGLSNLLIGSGIAITFLLYLFTPLSRTGLFWIAFVLTRPFGATMGDLLTKSPEKGGLGIGTAGASAVLLGILVVLIYLTGRKPAGDGTAQQPILTPRTTRGLQKVVLVALALVGLVGFTFTQDYALGAETHETVESVGGLMILICVLGWAWCRLYSSATPAGEVTELGPFSVVRNPTHLFSIIGAAGVGAQSGSLTVAAAFAATAAVAAVMLVRSEERAMAAAMGERYAAHLRAIPRFVPNLGQWRDDQEILIKPVPVMRSFVWGLLLLLTIPLAEGLQYLRQLHDLPILGSLP